MARTPPSRLLTTARPARPARRSRILRRAVPLAALALAAFVAGAIIAATPDHSERQLVTRYVNAWSARDYTRMYSLLDDVSRRRLSLGQFEQQLQVTAATATLLSLAPLRVASSPHRALVSVAMRVRTRLFGVLRETLSVPVRGSGSSVRVHLGPTLLFPGLRGREVLTRQAVLGSRGALLASDGTPLAKGPDRTSPIPDVAVQIVGTLGPIPTDQTARYAALGYPPDARVGQDGLERIFQLQLAGTPGGTLLAGRRVLAHATPRDGRDIHTTIVPAIEQAAVAALAGHYAGLAVMNPKTGGVEALAGIAFSSVQPPGSTMKIITSTAALQAGIVTLGSTFPVATSADLEGYQLQNANGEACGGTLLNAFAVSCNSVFAPLGARLGGARLVAMAKRFGFDQPAPFPGALESTIPDANQIGGSLAVGSSAIGQGKVQASALEMTDVAATIADGGRRPIPTLLFGARPQFVRVTSGHVAREVQRMMLAVVQFGTGTSAQIPGVTVAGKTGTAELRNTVTRSATPGAPPPSSPQNTDAWFVGYAPVPHPRVVAGALFPSQGAGGATAAPAVRQVLEAGLQAH